MSRGRVHYRQPSLLTQFVDHFVWETDYVRCCSASSLRFWKLRLPVQVLFSASHEKWRCFIWSLVWSLVDCRCRVTHWPSLSCRGLSLPGKFVRRTWKRCRTCASQPGHLVSHEWNHLCLVYTAVWLFAQRPYQKTKLKVEQTFSTTSVWLV